MKLVTFLSQRDPSISKIGAIHKEVVIDLKGTDLPNNMIDFIKMGETGLDINDYLQFEEGSYFMDEIILKSNFNPNKYLAVGLNYKKHVEEAKDLKDHHSNNVQIQEDPTIFNKQNSSVNDPY